VSEALRVVRVGAEVGDVEARGAHDGAPHLEDDLEHPLAAHSHIGVGEDWAFKAFEVSHLSHEAVIRGSILGRADDGEDELLRSPVDLLLRLSHVVVPLVSEVDVLAETLATIVEVAPIVSAIPIPPLLDNVGISRPQALLSRHYQVQFDRAIPECILKGF